MALAPIIINKHYSNSLSKSFNQIQFEIHYVNVYDAFDDGMFIDHYELVVQLRYLRLFSEYYGELQEVDSDYITLPIYGPEYDYPQEIDPDWTGLLEDNLACGWSYCKPFGEWYGNELCVKFIIRQVLTFGWEYDQEVVGWFGDNELYNSMTSFEVEKYGGALGVYFKVILVDN